MDQKIVHMASLKALQDGKSLENIFRFGTEASVPKESIEKALKNISNDPQFAGAPFLERLKEYRQPDELWDPFGEVPSNALLERRNQKIKDRFKKWKNNPGVLKRNFLLLLSIGFVFYGLLAISPLFRDFVWSIFMEAGDESFPYGYVLPWTPALLYWIHIKKTQIDIIKRLVADKFHWKYDPSEQRRRWDLAEGRFKELFARGNHNQFIEDQFWGTSKEIPFWGGLFHYERVSGSGKNRKTTKHNEHFFAFRVPKSLRHRFLMKPQTAFGSFRNFFRKKDIDTESIDFNKMFEVSYKGKKADNEQNIVNTLSPSVLARMVHTADEFGKYSVLLAGDTAIFVFKGRLFKKMKTNFLLKGVRLDPRDVNWLEHKLHKMLELHSELVPYLK